MNDDLTLGSRVVTEETDIVENSFSHSGFFDNLFTNSDLLPYSVNEVWKQHEQ